MAELHLGQLTGPGGFLQHVAIKRILPHLARDQAFVSMFLDEANIASRIRHPNVVSILELCQDDDELFIVMEYLVGESLSTLIQRMAARGTALPPALALYIVAEASKGLTAAHAAVNAEGESLGIVHRDISPQNILVTFDGTVKLVDFGIAKAADRVTKTDTGTFKGKLGYTAPEQFEGREVDARADVFSLGAVLYEALTGTRLFKRKSLAETLGTILKGTITPPSEVVPDLGKRFDGVCSRAVSLNPGDRFQTAAEFRAALLESGQEVAVPDPSGELAAFMKRELADRHTIHNEMLGQAAAGLPVPALPEHQHVEIPDAPAPRRRFPLLPAALLLLLLLLAGLVAFLALPKDTRLPDPPSLGETVSAGPAVEPHEREASQDAGAPVDSPSPEPRMVRLVVNSRPRGAQVTLNGQVLGRTPLETDVNARPGVVQITRRGYRGARRSLELAEDESVDVMLRQVEQDHFQPWEIPRRDREAEPGSGPPR